ncbi:MAG: DUF3575 domain-containing protein [Gemmatimonadota bacterium]|nr:DUF3575 domain-containing protein [Gemmatimonadota bacterium]
MLRLHPSVFASAILALAPVALHAQSAPNNVLSINPLSSILGFYSGEFEHALSPSTSIGIGGSYWSDDADNFGNGYRLRYYSTEAKLRYYPSARGLAGFNLGLTGGITRVSEHHTTAGSIDDGATAGSFGFEFAYNWLLGADRRLLISAGGGAKRLILTSDNVDHTTLAYPTIRFSVGFAF